MRRWTEETTEMFGPESAPRTTEDRIHELVGHVDDALSMLERIPGSFRFKAKLKDELEKAYILCLCVEQGLRRGG